MKYNYDLHIHSALSPCGDDEMTPNNIANMLKLVGCDIIAVSDHNSCKNSSAVIKVAEDIGLLCVPAMELCTCEEAHVLCLFNELKSALAFDELVYSKIPNIKNKPQVFGNQLIIDENDKITGIEEKLLITACELSAEELVSVLKEYGGIAIPAHIDKSSYSLLSSLGFIPKEFGFINYEVSKKTDIDIFRSQHPEYKNIIQNSDSHYLENIPDTFSEIELDNLSIKSLLNKLMLE